MTCLAGVWLETVIIEEKTRGICASDPPVTLWLHHGGGSRHHQFTFMFCKYWAATMKRAVFIGIECTLLEITGGFRLLCVRSEGWGEETPGERKP